MHDEPGRGHGGQVVVSGTGSIATSAQGQLWTISFWLLFGGLVLFLLGFGTPYLGVISFYALVEDGLGCSIPFDHQAPCEVLGHDIAWRFLLYRLPLVNIVITPIACLYAFWDLLLLWIGALLLTRSLRARAHRFANG